MKRFFTGIPLQVKGQLESYLYEAVGNTKLQMQEATAFPIIAAMEGYLEQGETFSVVAVVADSVVGRENLEKFQTEVSAVCEKTGAVCRGIDKVWIGTDESVSTQTATFQKLIEFVDDEDELFCCMTFGTKPRSTALMMAVQYAYRVKKNTSITCIVYGHVDRQSEKRADWKPKVYDMTALIQMDEIVRMLADRGVSNPKETIDRILSL